MFRKKSFVGLDIGSKAIDVVQIERNGSQWRLARVAEVATPPEAIKEGVVLDTAEVGLAIKMALREAHVSATSAVIGVSGGSVIVRTVRIPKMPEATLRKSIKYEAGRYVPSSIEDSYIEFEILGETEDGQMDVLIVAAPKDIVESRIAACEAAGLEVEIVDIEAFAMYRALVEASESFSAEEETIAIVDVGAETTNVSVVSNGAFSMTRSIQHGGDILTNALKSYFKLSDEDAESGKNQLNIADLTAEGAAENPPLRVIQPHVDELIREIRRSLNYYQSQQTESGESKPVTKLILSGGGARLNGLDQYMSHKLGLPVEKIGVLDNPRFVFGGHSDPGSGLELAVASGLAMRPLARTA